MLSVAFFVMLNAVMLSAIMLNVVKPSAAMSTLAFNKLLKLINWVEGIYKLAFSNKGGAMTFSIITFSITTFSIMELII